MGFKGAVWLLFLLILVGSALYLFNGGYFRLAKLSSPALFNPSPILAVITPDGLSLRVGPDGQLKGKNEVPKVNKNPSLGQIKIPEFLMAAVRPLTVRKVLADLESQGYSEVDHRVAEGKEEFLLATDEETILLYFEQNGEHLRWNLEYPKSWSAN